MCKKKNKEEKPKKKIREISKILFSELIVFSMLIICAGISLTVWCAISKQTPQQLKEIFSDTHYLYIIVIFVFYAVCLAECYIELKGYCKDFRLFYKKSTLIEIQESKMEHLHAQKHLNAQIDAMDKRFEIIKYFSLMPVFLTGFELLKDGVNIAEVIGNNYKSLVLLFVIMYVIFIVFQVRYYRLLKTELAEIEFTLYKIELDIQQA